MHTPTPAPAAVVSAFLCWRRDSVALAVSGSCKQLTVEELRLRLCEILGLKALARAGWIRVGLKEPESVAAHSWGVAWLVLALAPPGLDRGRALAIAILHDLGEVRIGDITPFDGITAADKRSREQNALVGLLRGFSRSSELCEYWLEYENQSSAEGRFVKACDRLDMALQAQRYAAESGIDTSSFVDSALQELPEGLLRELAGCAGPVAVGGGD